MIWPWSKPFDRNAKHMDKARAIVERHREYALSAAEGGFTPLVSGHANQTVTALRLLAIEANADGCKGAESFASACAEDIASCL